MLWNFKKKNLKGHLKSHTWVKQFKCRWKAFIRRDNLIGHRKMHTAQKWESYWLHAFSVSILWLSVELLANHLMIHTSENYNGDMPFKYDYFILVFNWWNDHIYTMKKSYCFFFLDDLFLIFHKMWLDLNCIIKIRFYNWNLFL